MPNFPGQIVLPLYAAQPTPMIDQGTVTKNQQTGLVRGGGTRDFNVLLRGIGRRIDRLPPRPYP